MRYSLLVPALMPALFVPSFTAHADTIQTFQLNGTFGPYTAGGTVTIDTTTDVITGANLNTNFDISGTPTVTSLSLSAPYANDWEISETWRTPSGDFVQSLDVVVKNLNLMFVYTGGPLCLHSPLNCGGPVSYGTILLQSYPFATGSLTLQQPSPTPEPGSFVLLTTGALGLAEAMRRKYQRGV